MMNQELNREIRNVVTQEPSVINISSFDGDAEKAVTSKLSFVRRKSEI